MARVCDEKGQCIDIEDNSSIISACEDLGVPFNCQDGECGICAIEIIEGAENLAELTRAEHNHLKDKSHRLACQCHIRSGEIKLKAQND